MASVCLKRKLECCTLYFYANSHVTCQNAPLQGVWTPFQIISACHAEEDGRKKERKKHNTISITQPKNYFDKNSL